MSEMVGLASAMCLRYLLRSMKTRQLLAALFLTAVIPSARALVIEGVTVPPQATASGQVLQLNGAGLRTVVLLVFPIKAYVAAFYAPAPLRTPRAVLASPGPLRFDFTFLQGVSNDQVAQAWKAQFDDSATHSYANLSKDLTSFIKLFGPVKKMGTQSIQLIGTDTFVYENGSLKGSVSGSDFQKTFLSLWFGSNPVMPSLKAALLGG